ncbi:hypothetical protein A3J19_01465 [Candidatus Daviesbacteria bacterium RIFCSPLOWO2_02_FULL_41_8]|uniref:Uncharacterized protein n=3 Tax=Candidatus Daviesiibacteriota TaxID=1752718 RepID=A0A1F5NH14_9BACT|nr:MAG: hypothetical protein A2871_01945 [Candidatus Daviesbacteria bacterium RIFCSPHIGHO2_01_FULL_41_23]OGE33073.1 MAG: hypothetical protein A3D83_02905 [Candidatus Daviesbacteria bacterium RIFCSPHIGHO2_02_FULL_41_10]OGE77001.1 MAG: hypothetical protein A3J19_01465 [Candidatus Daviesbacteria bacterium RIFCSPLOWO2_02_FULL_41_8]
MAERILLIGDTTGINNQEFCSFVKTVGCSYGGSFPSHKEGLPDATIREETCNLLAEAGILDPSPLVVCGSDQERAAQILQICRLRNEQNQDGEGELYVVIDHDPVSLAAAVKSVARNGNGCPSATSRITMIKLGAEYGYDHIDPETGLRLNALPRPLHPFPTHPDPAT